MHLKEFSFKGDLNKQYVLRLSINCFVFVASRLKKEGSKLSCISFDNGLLSNSIFSTFETLFDKSSSSLLKNCKILAKVKGSLFLYPAGLVAAASTTAVASVVV